MGQNFIDCDREQELLLPPSLREWLPEGHLAWFVIDAVAQLDLSAFYAAYRTDGHGRPAHDPAMMVALLLYVYAVGERSSRVERRCVGDVATRVICANRTPDHTTIARFRQRHEAALAGLFGGVLALCAEAGLLEVGVVAVDGTKAHANASHLATRDYEQVAAEILEDAGRVDAEEDERFGERRGDELPAELATAQGRRGIYARYAFITRARIAAAPRHRSRAQCTHVGALHRAAGHLPPVAVPRRPLPSLRWRPLARLSAIALILPFFGFLVVPGSLTEPGSFAEHGYPEIANPLAIEALRPFMGVVYRGCRADPDLRRR